MNSLPPLPTCKRCGKPIDISLFVFLAAVPPRTRSGELCYDCAYWLARIKKMPPDHYVIGGCLYFCRSPKQSNTSTRPYYSKLIYAIDANNKVHTFLSVKFVDLIPEAFRKRLPNQLVFLDRSIALRVLNFRSDQCRNKGCWDRKACFWYRSSDSAWNRIPASHSVGSEDCPSFINAKTLFYPYVNHHPYLN